MNRICCLASLLLLAPLIVSGADSDAEKSAPTPSAYAIMERTLDEVRALRERGFEKEHTLDHVNVRIYFDGAGETKSREEKLYKAYPIRGHQYYELIQRDGKPLAGSDLRKEQKRQRDFREEIKHLDFGETTKQPGQSDLQFNRELLDRYKAEYLGRETVRGRPAFVLRFEPKSDNLPVRNRMDYALNKSRGKLWIDVEEYVPARMEFELIETVRFWGGILGSLTKLEGRLEVVRLENGWWHYTDFELYLDGRILFKSLHQRLRLDWRNFQRISPEQAVD